MDACGKGIYNINGGISETSCVHLHDEELEDCIQSIVLNLCPSFGCIYGMCMCFHVPDMQIKIKISIVYKTKQSQ